MRRREFITLLGSAAAVWPLTARGQQPGRRPKLGVVYLGPVAMAGPRVEALLNGLRAAGYGGPEQIEIVLRTSDGDPTLVTPLVAEVVERNVDVILAISSVMVQAFRQATRTIPIVALDLETDPVDSGLVAGVTQPGGNITGLFFDFPDFTKKWLELLREAIPQLSRIAVLWDPATALTPRHAVEQAASSLSIQLDVLEVRTRSDFEEAFVTANRRGAGAVLMLSSPLIGANAQPLAELAIHHRLPAVTLFPDFARAGGLMAYGVNLLEMYRQAGVMVGKVLQGRKPAELPIERPTKFELVLNLRAAKRLGIEIPTSLLLRADEVIE
jgi:putative tryptophan/tyrosine transport system substrate-binding protein